MSVALKIRWRRLVNQISYLHEENDFVQSIIKASAPDFNEHYLDFCERLEIDIKSLNGENEERIKNAYGIDDETGSIEDTAKALSDLQQQMVTYIEPPVYSTAPEQEPTDYEMTQDEKEVHDAFNKLFRKIAMELHPDKLSKVSSSKEKKAKTEKFNQAKRALDKRQYFILLEIAKDLDIRTPKNYKQQIRWMKKEISKIEETISAGKKTYNYLFSECETESERDSLITQFMNQLFGINIQK